MARSRSDIEMSKPLSQITRAEDAFSGRLTVQRSLICRQSFGRGCQNLPVVRHLFEHSTFSETHMVI